MPSNLDDLLHRWTEAGVIDAETAARIHLFEREQSGTGRFRWPILLALAFGALLVATGVLLFVSAHWDSMSPSTRFGLVLTLVALFHVAGAVVAERFPAMSSALHAIGTASLGGGIYLSGQIFNLDEHWPGGIMVWALGAAIAWVLLKQTPQFALTAILVPGWLASEWAVVAANHPASRSGGQVLAAGIFLLVLSYFTVTGVGTTDIRRRTLFWIGGIALLPAAGALAAHASYDRNWTTNEGWPISIAARTIGWIVAIGLPMLVAIVFRGREAWVSALAVAWTLPLLVLDRTAGAIPKYAWWAIGAIGLVAWGVREGRRERINMGAGIFAATVIAFYFSEVMDKLGRSASLVGLGLLFLGGGWALERVRRRLIREAGGRS